MLLMEKIGLIVCFWNKTPHSLLVFMRQPNVLCNVLYKERVRFSFPHPPGHPSICHLT